ncbi:hypothetical protein PG999_003519 [Apiospora kogelbergensis]|uniref:Uncharacterized protein n=1 Tax=Apiospora kogelbergensis TaxID=1337665 RepID=A0AAW0R3Z1_9PEZI
MVSSCSFSSSDDAGSLHVLLVSNLPLGSIQTSVSVKSTERLSSNVILLRLTPGTTTSFSADGAHSDVGFQVQGNTRNMLQLPEFLIWYPLPAIGAAAPQLLNNSPSGRDLLVFATKGIVGRPGNASRSRGGGYVDGGGNRGTASLVPMGQSIAVESDVATTTAATGVEIVVPIHSTEEGRRRWRLGYYIVTPKYPRGTIAKLLGGGDDGDGRLPPLWFSSRDLDPPEEQLLPGWSQDEGAEEEDVEMEEADDEKSSRRSGGSSNLSPTAARRSTKEARARTRRRPRDRQRSKSDSDDLGDNTNRRRDYGRAGKAGGG